MVTLACAFGIEMKIGSDPCRIWISDMGEAGWDII